MVGFFFDPPILLFEVVVLFQLIIFRFSQKKELSNKSLILEMSKTPVLVLTVIGIFYVIIHYLLFPLLAHRFFLGEYMMAGLGLLAVLSAFIHRKDSTSL
jgi:hypothetical protein